MVECRTDHSCGGSPITSTIMDCCDPDNDYFDPDNDYSDPDNDTSGLAYTIPGNQTCYLCGKITILDRATAIYIKLPFVLKQPIIIVTELAIRYATHHTGIAT